MAHAPQRALLRRYRFLLSFNAGLFVMFSFSQLGQYTRFFAEFFKPPDGALDRLIFSDSNTRHGFNHPQSIAESDFI